MATYFNHIIIGGGAAGFFAALTAKQANPDARVLLLEKSIQLLSKVRISGGGRCNVTHACFDPKHLVQNYPRGNKALIGPFTRFQPLNTIEWFESHAVALKTEEDGRIFPVTDSSQTIIDCLMLEAQRQKIEIRIKQAVEQIQKQKHCFQIKLKSGEIVESDTVLLATGSSPQGYAFSKAFGHTIQEPVPSLFTFNVPASPLIDLAGISVERATLQLVDSPYSQTGPLLITHWGFSGPAALKLSAWGARWLHSHNYKARLSINWLPDYPQKNVMEQLLMLRKTDPMRNLATINPFRLPKNFWKMLLELAGIDGKKRLAELSNEHFSLIGNLLQNNIYNIEGKTTYKEEFVTCGGVTLDEVNFKTMESRLCPGLFFAGEILDVDGVTGGFNFQNAWTTGWISGQSMANYTKG